MRNKILKAVSEFQAITNQSTIFIDVVALQQEAVAFDRAVLTTNTATRLKQKAAARGKNLSEAEALALVSDKFFGKLFSQTSTLPAISDQELAEVIEEAFREDD